MKRWIAVLPLAALAALAVLFVGYSLHRNPQVPPDALVGQAAPDLTLPALDGGRPVRLREAAAGGPVLVNLFASWCAPCEVEHPALLALKSQGVRIVGIAYKDAPQNTQAFLGRLGDPFGQVLVDRDGRAGVEFGISGVPETFLVGADGTILAKHAGPLTPEAAERLLDRARR